MSGFSDDLRHVLEALEGRIQKLPEEMDSAAKHLDRAKLIDAFQKLRQDYKNSLQEEQSIVGIGGLATGLALLAGQATKDEVTSVKAMLSPDVRIVVGNGEIKVVAISRLARENKTTASEAISNLQEQGYTVLAWDQYEEVLDEIGNLISEGKGGRITAPPRTAISLDDLNRLMPKL